MKILKIDSYNLFQIRNIVDEQIISGNINVLKSLHLLMENGDVITLESMIKNDKFIIRFNDIGCTSYIEYF